MKGSQTSKASGEVVVVPNAHAPPSPRPPGTPRNRSNPRPVNSRAVPLNPIQALKQRRLQQESGKQEPRTGGEGRRPSGSPETDPTRRPPLPPSQPESPRYPEPQYCDNAEIFSLEALAVQCRDAASFQMDVPEGLHDRE